MEKKLKVTTSKFKNPLTFNEWVEMYKVSSAYIEPTKYFQGNAGSPRVTMDTKMEFDSSFYRQDWNNFTGILNKLKTKIKWVEKIV
jgi:hypothetical protein